METRIIKTFSGNGSERNRNGDSAQSTSWAQPSGVCVKQHFWLTSSHACSGISYLPGTPNKMVVADSESSSIRELNLSNGGSQGISGGDPLFADNLFRFGDRDGNFSQVLLQHPLGVLAIEDDKVYILVLLRDMHSSASGVDR